MNVCTPDNFVKHYQATLNRKDNNMETNLTFRNDYNEAVPSTKYDDIKENIAYKDDHFEGLRNNTH